MLHFQPTLPGSTGECMSVPAGTAGFEHLTFKVLRLAPGESFSGETGANELGIVLLGGICSVSSSAGEWRRMGRRAHVFDGVAYTLYLPIGTEFKVAADTACEFALCYCAARTAYPARLIAPEDVEIEIRGGGNATRQINHLLKPEFPADRILVVEVFTPAGNWSSYPPHKHDEDNPPGEVILEETYYFRTDGFAVQKLYSPRHGLDVTETV